MMLFGDPDFDDLNEILYTKCNHPNISIFFKEMPTLHQCEAISDEDDEEEEKCPEIR
jgi:hypothetical protein